MLSQVYYSKWNYMDPDSLRTISQDLNWGGGGDNVIGFAGKPIRLNAMVLYCSYGHREDHRLR